MIDVVVVDDEPMVCAYLRTILDSAGDIKVVDHAYDGSAAVAAVVRHRPRVVLTDVRMPGVDGIAVITKLVALPDPPAVVVLTASDVDQYLVRAMNAGAMGFLVKSTPPDDLVNLVRVAADGHIVLSPVASRRLVAASAGREQAGGHARVLIEQLTNRERDVLACLGQGEPNAAIAARLHLSEATVKSYVSRMLVKLACHNRTQAGLLAHESGLVFSAHGKASKNMRPSFA